MQDRVNYRFWDTKEKVMLDWGCICQTAFNCTREEGNEIQRYGLMYWVFTSPLRFIPLQCTGLKDKNGKLIFEGDILKIEMNKLDGESYNQDSYEEAFYGYVLWYSSSYEICLDLDNEKTKSFPLYFDRYEVIGNIYENPELLKEVQE